MSSFTSELWVTPLNERKWKLLRPFTYHVGSRNSRQVIKVPKGFVTDYASVPWIFWQFLPAWGRYGKGAVVHDYLYQHHLYSRAMSDLIFKETMIAGGTSKWKANLMYWGVRLFGGLAFK